MKNLKLNLIILLIIIGFGYNIYLSFFSYSEKEKELTKEEQIEEIEKELKLAPKVLDITNDTVKKYLETKKVYQEYLKQSDAIIKDSLDCNCPNKTK